MTTAREQLFDEVVALIEKNAPEALDADMRKTMAKYRVQTKPGVDIPPGATARDALGERIVALVRSGASDLKDTLGTTIDDFRMQLKQASAQGGPPKPKGSMPPRPVRAAIDAPSRGVPDRIASRNDLHRADHPLRTDPSPRYDGGSTLPLQALGVGDPPRRSVRAAAEPAVAGGPRLRKKARGECPKCHSMGVVLARSYSGDEYYSCIYCGWQAFTPTDEADPNASLAVRLLRQTLGND